MPSFRSSKSMLVMKWLIVMIYTHKTHDYQFLVVTMKTMMMMMMMMMNLSLEWIPPFPNGDIVRRLDSRFSLQNLPQQRGWFFSYLSGGLSLLCRYIHHHPMSFPFHLSCSCRCRSSSLSWLVSFAVLFERWGKWEKVVINLFGERMKKWDIMKSPPKKWMFTRDLTTSMTQPQTWVQKLPTTKYVEWFEIFDFNSTSSKCVVASLQKTSTNMNNNNKKRLW